MTPIGAAQLEAAMGLQTASRQICTCNYMADAAEPQGWEQVTCLAAGRFTYLAYTGVVGRYSTYKGFLLLALQTTVELNYCLLKYLNGLLLSHRLL